MDATMIKDETLDNLVKIAGIKAELKEPSANKDLKVFGILNATKRASATAKLSTLESLGKIQSIK